MITTELFRILIDKMPDAIFEWERDIEEFKHPIYSWTDSNGNQRIHALIPMRKATPEEPTRAMYTIGSEDPVTQDDIHNAFEEIVDVIGGNLKSVIEDTGNLTMPQVSLDKPWVLEPPLASLTLNWRRKFLVVSISDLALEPQDQREGNVRIVVADNSRVMRQVMVHTPRQADFDREVMETEDGVQALQLALNETPDLVLSDWNMPNILDIEILQQLRASGSKIPVGLVTSEGSP